MGRWVAIGKTQGWDNIVQFTKELAETSKWRVNPQTTITTVIALEDGRLLAECHATKKEDFEAWLKDKNWKVDSITPIKHIAKTGTIWKIT
jgi:hypothetical protein